MARPLSGQNPQALIDSLVRTREALERVISQLEVRKVSLHGHTVLEEQVYRRSKRALRKISND